MEQKYFKIGRILYTSSDATCGYELLFIKPGTLKQFIEDVISNKREWGYIGIWPKDKITTFGDLYIEYEQDKLLSTFPSELLDKQIDIKARHTVFGGWGRMDYLVSIKER